MAIYLIDYENVYIEGLQGIDQLTEEDTLHIFYTQHRCGLTFGLYEQLIACKAKVNLNEVAMSLKSGDPVKNALDIQLMMFAGFLIGAKQTQNLYIVSRDKDFLLGTGFYEQFIHDEKITMQIIPTVEASFVKEAALLEDAPVEVPVTECTQEPESYETYDAFVQSIQQKLDAPEEAELAETMTDLTSMSSAPTASFASLCEKYAKALDAIPAAMPMKTGLMEISDVPSEPDPLFTVQYHNTVRNLLGKNSDEETVSRICEMISVSDSLVEFNNALAKYYRDGQRAKVVYHKFKPRFEDLRHLSRASVRNR